MVYCQQAEIWLLDPLEAIYPDQNNLSKYGNKWSADYPQGSFADVHLLVKVPKGTKIALSASLADRVYNDYWSKLIAVPVEENTGLDSRTEQFKGIKNPYVIRRAPFHVFEVIKPLEVPELVSVDNYSAFRLSIPTEEWPVGRHKIKIVVSGDSWEKVGHFNVNIYDAVVPALIHSKFFYTNWFSLKNMEEKHEVERWTDDWFNVLQNYAKMMAHGRQNSITIPGELITYENDEIKLEEEMLLRFINVFRDQGFTWFESPHLMNRGENDDWGDPELKVALTKKRYYKENGKEDVARMVTLFKHFAEKNGLTKNWLQHISDEPTAIQAKCYADISRQVKSIFPEIKVMEATNDRDGLVGAVDFWCPLINDFQENESFFRAREKHGDRILVYTCLIPGGPWLNRTLDMEHIRQVYFGWGAAHYNTLGFLHWGLNYYVADPFTQSAVHHPAPGAAPNNFLPAGDTHILYPGDSGPLSSIRFEAHRTGIEDYELLQKLKDKNNSLAQKQINKLFKDYTTYSMSLKKYRKVKRKILKELIQ